MAVLEMIEDRAARISELRQDLDRVRDVLDRTDAVLAVSDQALERIDEVVRSGTARRVALSMLVIAGVVAVGVPIVIAARRRSQTAHEGAEQATHSNR